MSKTQSGHFRNENQPNLFFEEPIPKPGDLAKTEKNLPPLKGKKTPAPVNFTEPREPEELTPENNTDENSGI